jgi:outer membrane protein assembly factor BamB
MKTPNTKHQTPKKSQIPNPNPPRDVGRFELGTWSFSGVWSLVFGVWVVAAITLVPGIGANTASGAAVQNWPRFRGPNGSGVSESRDLPVEFGPMKNLAWRTAVPAGHSSPVVWDNRVFLTGYEETRCFVVCLDLKSGKRLWARTVEATRMERKSKPNDAASSTPAADETGIYALFSGFGLLAFSHNGQERWHRPLDPFTPPHGMASSPVLAAGTVVVVADQVGDSYLAAFEAASGKPKWKTPRPNLVGGYATPVLDRTDILIGGPMELVAYSVATGERRWSIPKMGVMPIASPICVGDRIYVYNDAVPPYEQLTVQMKADRNGDGKISPDEFPDPSFKEAVRAIDRAYGNGDGAVDKEEWDGALKLMRTMNSLVAVDLAGQQSKERWRTTKMLTDTATPLLYRGLLYLVKNGGLLTSVDPESGELLRQDRIAGVEGSIFASPVAADGKLFILNESGKLAVLQAGRDWGVLAVNELAENCYATPAIAKGVLVVRSESALWAFQNRDQR